MPIPANRSIVIISSLVTLLVLSAATLAIALHNGWLHTAAADVSSDAVLASSHPTPTEPLPEPVTQGAMQDEVVAYRQKLEEAYRALDDAYAQIRVLQSTPTQLAAARNDDDRLEVSDGNDRRERRSERRQSERRRSHDDD